MNHGVFDGYAAYYDLLNRDKNYAAEARYVHGLLQRERPGASNVLEFGCGTGGHAREFGRLGYRVTGLDLSPGMVALAREQLRTESSEDRLRFIEGDLRTYRSPERFDAVLALFHVMSYQTSNADLAAAIGTAAEHLLPGGAFIFDCWYGPGVMTDPPVRRVREFYGDGFHVKRQARPVHHPNSNRVDVYFDIEVRHRDGLERIQEVHPMRYLFAPEMMLFLEAAGLRHVALERWLDGGEPGLDTWNACFIARK